MYYSFCPGVWVVICLCATLPPPPHPSQSLERKVEVGGSSLPSFHLGAWEHRPPWLHLPFVVAAASLDPFLKHCRCGKRHDSGCNHLLSTTVFDTQVHPFLHVGSSRRYYCLLPYTPVAWNPNRAAIPIKLAGLAPCQSLLSRGHAPLPVLPRRHPH